MLKVPKVAQYTLQRLQYFVCRRCWKKLKMVLHIFAYNLLNFQWIFNLNFFLKSGDLELTNHTIKCYMYVEAYKRCQKSKPCDGILRKLWAKMCKTILSFLWHLPHKRNDSPYRVYWATFDTFDMSNFTLYWWPYMHFCTSDMNSIALYWGEYTSNNTVDPNSFNYIKIQLKALNYFELETLWIR